MEFTLDERLSPGQNVAVDVIKQVEPGEQQKRAQCRAETSTSGLGGSGQVGFSRQIRWRYNEYHSMPLRYRALRRSDVASELQLWCRCPREGETLRERQPTRDRMPSPRLPEPGSRYSLEIFPGSDS